MSLSNSSDHQSESMGRSSDDDDEVEIPMKGPSIHQHQSITAADATSANNETSFLDEDFLSFGHVDNGGDGNTASNAAAPDDDSKSKAKNKMAGRKRERPYDTHHTNTATYEDATPSIPWLDNNRNDHDSQSQRYNNPPYDRNFNSRGYNNNNNHYRNHHYAPPTPPLIQLHNEIVSFVQLMSPTPQELAIRTTIERRIIELAHGVFGKEDCEVLPFGSQVTGLALPGSDIDFVIRFANTDTKKRNGTSSSDNKNDDDEVEEDVTARMDDPLQRIADAVKAEFGIKSELEMDATNNTDSNNNDDNNNNKEHLSYLEIITQTRVPLVKFTIEPYNLDIDICFDQPHGPESADLMHRFMESMPPLRPLTFCLKYFLASREINKPFTGGIGSYLLQLMIVSFLQHRSRADLNRGYGGSGKHFNLGSLLLDFLELYGLDFNYVTTGISVRHDGYYFPKGQLDKREYFWQPNRPSSIAVENPLDPTMDVGAGAYRIQMISRVFEHAFKTLLAYVSEPMERDGMDSSGSILAKILPPTEEMNERRRLKDELMERKDDGNAVGSNEGGVRREVATEVNDKQRGMKGEQDRRSSSKNWDKNKDNKKRRHSGGDDHGGGKYKSKKKKKKRSSK